MTTTGGLRTAVWEESTENLCLIRVKKRKYGWVYWQSPAGSGAAAFLCTSRPWMRLWMHEVQHADLQRGDSDRRDGRTRSDKPLPGATLVVMTAPREDHEMG